MSSSSIIGKPTIHLCWKVPASEEAEIDAFWLDHEKWMRSAHTFGKGDEPCLLKYYIAKGKELNNPMDPKSGETGNLLYIMVSVEGKSWRGGGGEGGRVTWENRMEKKKKKSEKHIFVGE